MKRSKNSKTRQDYIFSVQMFYAQNQNWPQHFESLRKITGYQAKNYEGILKALVEPLYRYANSKQLT